MLKNLSLLFLFLLPSLLQGQDFICGFKEECKCARTGVEASFKTGDIVFEGKVLFIDTVLISEVITVDATWGIEQNRDTFSSCAKTVLQKEKVVVIEIQVNEMFKGVFQNRIINICTPLESKFCGYVDFEKGERFIVYGSKDETADIFFTYNLDSDFFILKNEYKYWTNFCRRTAKTDDAELKILRRLKQ